MLKNFLLNVEENLVKSTQKAKTAAIEITIPKTIDIKNILKRLTTNPDFSEHATNLLIEEKVRPKQGKKDDPAHPAIHPTGKKPPKLVEGEKRLYDLITWRFLSSLSDPAISNQTTAIIDVNGHIFYQISRLSIRRKYSKFSVRFNSSRLLRVMERKRIGTKATRTSVIDTLFRRGYIRGESIQITELGFTVVETLNDLCPEILSVELTRELEENIEKVQSDDLNEKDIFESTIKTLNPILSTIKENEIGIGKKLLTLPASGIKSNGCRVCHRDNMDNSVFCEYHQMAYSNIEKGYENWRYALDVNWADYLTRMSKKKGVGLWVKEVIESILKQSHGSDV